MTYHVVCHQCDFEWLKDTWAVAMSMTDGHARTTGHDVESAEVDGV